MTVLDGLVRSLIIVHDPINDVTKSYETVSAILLSSLQIESKDMKYSSLISIGVLICLGHTMI